MKEEVFDELEGKIMNGVSSTFTATEVVKMNRELRKMRNQIDTRIRQLERTREEFTVEDILAQNAFGTGKPQFYLLRYINTQIERKQELKKVGMAAAYKSTRSSLAKFISRPMCGCRRLIWRSSGDMRISCIVTVLPAIR